MTNFRILHNGGQNYFRFQFWPQIATSRTQFPYKKCTYRRLSASISEVKRFIISAFALSEFRRARIYSRNWTTSSVYGGIIWNKTRYDNETWQFCSISVKIKFDYNMHNFHLNYFSQSQGAYYTCKLISLPVSQKWHASVCVHERGKRERVHKRRACVNGLKSHRSLPEISLERLKLETSNSVHELAMWSITSWCLTIPQVGVVRVTWPISSFLGPRSYLWSGRS